MQNDETENLRALSCTEQNNVDNGNPRENEINEFDKNLKNKNRFSKQSTPTQKLFEKFALEGKLRSQNNPKKKRKN
jgi:hypothetical protein